MNTLRDILLRLELPDYEFLSRTLETWFGFNNRKTRVAAIRAFESDPSPEHRERIVSILDAQIRYLGSADVAYRIRKMRSREGGISFDEIVSDVAKRLKVTVAEASLDVRLETLVNAVVSRKLSKLRPREIEQVLATTGADTQKIHEFSIRQGAVVGAVALIARFFGTTIAEKVVSDVAINVISQYIGKQMARRLVTELGKRFPWWGEWAGPIMWIASGMWLVFDLQGPAMRKSIPVVLYLGLCVTRLKGSA
jgi:uncharacterized protein YaaW (UPF0174 family)